MGIQFKWRVVLRKVLEEGALAFLVLVVAVGSTPVPENVNAWADWKPWAMAVGVAVLRGIMNLVKTRWLPGNPIGNILPMMLVGILAASMLTGCITVTTTAPDGTVTETRQVDMVLLTQMPGLIGDLGTELARIEAALDDTDSDAPPTADELARRERRQQIIDRLLELGIEVIQDNDNAPAQS